MKVRSKSSRIKIKKKKKVVEFTSILKIIKIFTSRLVEILRMKGPIYFFSCSII